MLRRPVMVTLVAALASAALASAAVVAAGDDAARDAGDDAAAIRLMTLDPGHFHAALVQKTMYPEVSPVVHVYAPAGPDVEDHLRRIEGFNTRPERPTRWREVVYRGDDALERMLRERPGNVVVISGDNRRKAAAILACAEAGLHVLADKPMCIDAEGFDDLRRAFAAAERQGVLVYDVMTERSAITAILQRSLAQETPVFGVLRPGTAETPAIHLWSVHHFFKQVAGKPLERPAWYFDTRRQGEGIVDVTTHLVDLSMWVGFPDRAIDAGRDVEVLRARRWPTRITREQFETVTRAPDFPPALAAKLDASGALPCYANGEMLYRIGDVHVLVAVEWAFQAPPGAADRHGSVVRGTRANLVVRQGETQGYRPELYVEPAAGVDLAVLAEPLAGWVERQQATRPGVAMEANGAGWRISIPGRYRVGHEAHFAEVMERFLRYVEDGGLPAWEEPNMLAKYATTTAAREKARAP